MTDKKILKLAAKAAKIKGKYYRGILNEEWVDGVIYYQSDGQQLIWNPLVDDGQALRLAVQLHLLWTITSPFESVQIDQDHEELCAATRRAIVKAAAEIGKEKIYGK